MEQAKEMCIRDRDCTEDITGTLRAQEHGHQPLVFDAHGQDARYRGPVDRSATLSASFLNQPLVVSPVDTPALYENHGIDARYTGPHSIAPTLDVYKRQGLYHRRPGRSGLWQTHFR